MGKIVPKSFDPGLAAKKYSPDGEEVMDATPVEMPVNLKRPPSLQERVRDLVRSERLRDAAMQAGKETFEEADDFDVGDDYDPTSPYEQNFDQMNEPVPSKQKTMQEERPVPSKPNQKAEGKGKKPSPKPEESEDE